MTDSNCPFSTWMTYQGTTLFKHDTLDAYLYVTRHMRIDADGAPNAYHPDGASGLDSLANAGYPGSRWWPSVLVPDPEDPAKPYIQPSGPHAGFYVSQTALQAPGVDRRNPARYVDASTVPFIVFPGSFFAMSGTGRLGDLGWAVHLASGRSSPFIVADIGPSNAALGEVSIALATALSGQPVSARNGAGAPKGPVAYVVFRKSSADQPDQRWPLAASDMQQAVDTHLAQAGGPHAVSQWAASLAT